MALAQDQRFTRPNTDHWARARAGVSHWELDVAACKESHLAKRYYTARDNALVQPWNAKSIWANIPFSCIAPWVVRAWAAMDCGEAGTIAMLMPATRTEQDWWQALIEPWRDDWPRRMKRGLVWLRTHYPPERSRFGHPGNPRGHGVGSPPFACVLLVWSRTAPQTSVRFA